MSVSEARLTLHFDVHEPIELMDMTLSFTALASQYRRFLVDRWRGEGRKPHDTDVKLYITEIKNNCIYAEFAGASDILGSLMPLFQYVQLFTEFAEQVKTGIEFFKAFAGQDKHDARDVPFSKRECESFADFLSVVAKNKGGALGLGVAEYSALGSEAKRHVEFRFHSDDALTARRGALVAQRVLEERSDADHKDVLLYFYQTNTDDPRSDGRTGERAIIPSIGAKDLPVYFISDLDQDRIKSYKNDPTKNPFRASYRVDVNVEADRNKIPRFYRVLRLHEIIDPDTD